MTAQVNASMPAVDPGRLAPALSLFLLVGLLLTLVFLLATYVLVRTARRSRRAIDRRRAAPTPMEDVWAMHKLPGEIGDE